MATAEGIHARRHFSLLESIADTQTNLEQAFQSENTVGGIHYIKMLQEAEEEFNIDLDHALEENPKTPNTFFDYLIKYGN